MFGGMDDCCHDQVGVPLSGIAAEVILRPRKYLEDIVVGRMAETKLSHQLAWTERAERALILPM